MNHIIPSEILRCILKKCIWQDIQQSLFVNKKWHHTCCGLHIYREMHAESKFNDTMILVASQLIKLRMLDMIMYCNIAMINRKLSYFVGGSANSPTRTVPILCFMPYRLYIDNHFSIRFNSNLSSNGFLWIFIAEVLSLIQQVNLLKYFLKHEFIRYDDLRYILCHLERGTTIFIKYDRYRIKCQATLDKYQGILNENLQPISFQMLEINQNWVPTITFYVLNFAHSSNINVDFKWMIVYPL
jgi:hypothetical protein